MGTLEASPRVEEGGSWIWRIVILVVVILFIVGFYLLLSGGSFPSFFDPKEDGNSSGGSWLDSLGRRDDSDNDVIPAPPALPS